MRLSRLFWIVPLILVIAAGILIRRPAAAKCNTAGCNGTSCVDTCDPYIGDPAFTLEPWSALNPITYCVDFDGDGVYHCASNTAQTFKVYCSTDHHYICICQRVTGGCRAAVTSQTKCTPSQ